MMVKRLLAVLMSAVAIFAKPALADPLEKPVTLTARDFCAAAIGGKTKKYGVIRPGLQGWLFREKVDYRIKPILDSQQWTMLAVLVQKLKQRGTQLVIVVPPPRELVSASYLDFSDPLLDGFSLEKVGASYRILQNQMRSAGAIVPDILEQMRRRSGGAGVGGVQSFYLSKDIHWSTTGAQIAAESTAAALANNKAFLSLPRKKFETRLASSEIIQQDFVRAIAATCDTSPASDKLPIYETKAIEDDSIGGLLASDGVGIALLGTSFSVWRIPNFAGFLQQSLSTEVINYAISGGGHEAAIEAYLSSSDFANAQPKFLIWEFLPHDLPSLSTFRILLGTLDGDCPKNSLVTKSARFAPGATPLLRNSAPLTAAQRLFLSTSSSALRKFDVQLNYSDGHRERVNVDASRWTSPVKEIGLRLLPGKELTSANLIPGQRIDGDVQVRVCKK